MVNNLAEVVAAGNLVLDLAENLADFVLDRVWTTGFLFETVQIGKQLQVHIGDQIIAGLRIIVIKGAIFFLWRGPG